MAHCYAVLLFLCRSMVCLSSSCFNSPTKFQIIWIFCRRWPLDLSGAWTIIFFTNSLTIVGVGKGYPFRKMHRIFSCWEFPKPLCVLSLNIPSGKRHLLHFAPHSIQRHTFDFAKATREIFETYSSFYTTLRLN